MLSIISLIEVNDYFYHDKPKAQDWYGLVAYLDEHMSPDDVVIYGHPSPDIEYYNRDRFNFAMTPRNSTTIAEDTDTLLAEYG